MMEGPSLKAFGSHKVTLSSVRCINRNLVQCHNHQGDEMTGPFCLHADPHDPCSPYTYVPIPTESIAGLSLAFQNPSFPPAQRKPASQLAARGTCGDHVRRGRDRGLAGSGRKRARRGAEWLDMNSSVALGGMPKGSRALSFEL